MQTPRAARTRTPWGLMAAAASLTIAFLSAPLSPAAAGRSPSCVVGLALRDVIAPPDEWELRDPESLAVDHRGNLVVADTGNHRVVVMTREGAAVTEFGGYGWEAGQFDTPSDLFVHEGFFTYVLDEGNRRIERFDVDGDYVDHAVEADEAGSPVAVAVGREGGFYILDADSQTVLALSQFDEELDPVGQFGTGEGGLVRPSAVAIGPSGEIGVADPGRHAVLVFDEFGSPLHELSLPDTLAPGDVVFDEAGACLVVDAARGRVVAFPPGGGAATATLEIGDAFRPVALTLDGEGTLLVLDSLQGRVLVIEMAHGECGVRP